MPQQGTQTPTDIKSILDPLQVNDSIKADVWDAYHSANTPQEFQAKFDKLNIPQDAKAALWDAKFPSTEMNPTTGLVAPAGTIGETPGYFREALGGIGRGIAGVGSFLKHTLTPHEIPGDMTREQNAQIGPMGRLLYNPIADIATSLEGAEKARKKAAVEGEGTAGQTLAFLENSPLGGIVQKAEEAGPGRFKMEPATVGAITEAGTAYALPKVAAAVVGSPAAAKERLQPFMRKVTGVEPAVREAVTKTAEKQTTALADTAAENAERARVLGERKQAESELKTTTKDYFSQEDQAKAAAKQQNDANWEAWRNKVGNTSVDMEPVRQTIERVSAKFPEVREIIKSTAPDPEEASAANQQFLADRQAFMRQYGYGQDYAALSPERQAQVDSMMDRMGLRPEEGVPLDVSKPMSMKQLHELKTQIGWKVFRNEYPPNVTGAMKQVLKSLDQAEVRGSISAGAVDELNVARESHAKFQEAFGRAKPERATVGEQRKKEANPEAYREGQRQKRVEAGSKVEPGLAKAHEATSKAREKLKQFPTEKQLEPKPAPETPEVDLQQTARHAIEQRAKNWGAFNARDVGILASSVIAGPIIKILAGKVGEGASSLLPEAAVTYEAGKFASSRLLRNPKVIDWLSRTPPAEAEALSRIPGVDKVKLLNGLTDEAIAAAKGGRAVQLSREASRLLGQARVAAIVAASSSNIQTPAQAKQAVPPPQ